MSVIASLFRAKQKKLMFYPFYKLVFFIIFYIQMETNAAW